MQSSTAIKIKIKHYPWLNPCPGLHHLYSLLVNPFQNFTSTRSLKPFHPGSLLGVLEVCPGNLGRDILVLTLHSHSHRVQCVVCSLQFLLCSVLFVVCSVQCVVCSVQCVVCGEVCGVQCLVYSVQPVVSSLQCVVNSVYFVYLCVSFVVLFSKMLLAIAVGSLVFNNNTYQSVQYNAYNALHCVSRINHLPFPIMFFCC